MNIENPALQNVVFRATLRMLVEEAKNKTAHAFRGDIHSGKTDEDYHTAKHIATLIDEVYENDKVRFLDHVTDSPKFSVGFIFNHQFRYILKAYYDMVIESGVDWRDSLWDCSEVIATVRKSFKEHGVPWYDDISKFNDSK